MPINVIIFGPPASGKGSVSDAIKAKYNVAHISTGDLFRARAKEDTNEARELAALMAAGALIPDDTVIGLVKDTVSSDVKCVENGYLLDGFPRSKQQASKMFAADASEETKIASPDVVIVLEASFQVLADRITTRRIDPHTNKVYNIKLDAIEDEVKERLIQRADDTEEALKTRVNTFVSSTDDIISILSANPHTRIVKIDASQPLEDVKNQAVAAVAGEPIPAPAAAPAAPTTDAIAETEAEAKTEVESAEKDAGKKVEQQVEQKIEAAQVATAKAGSCCVIM